MVIPALGLTEKKQEVWKKGDKAISQAQIYTKLPKGHYVFFYEEGQEGTDGYCIEIAIDPISSEEFLKKFKEIRSMVNENSRGRKTCMFNL